MGQPYSMKARVILIVTPLIALGVGFLVGWLDGNRRVEAVAEETTQNAKVLNEAFKELAAKRDALEKHEQAALKLVVQDHKDAFTAICRRSDGCRSSGECSYQEPSGGIYPLGRCVPASDEDCRNSSDCQSFGACAVVPDREHGLHRCKPTKDEHCATHYNCSEKPCRVIANECVHR